MVTDDDRGWFKFQRQRLEDARIQGDRDLYHRIGHDMLIEANRLVADQRWWEVWSKEEACSILQRVLALPPYLGEPTAEQVQDDVAVHQRIRTTLHEQIESLETTKLVVEIVDYAATAASMAIGAGTATVAIRELVKRVGARKAGEILVREFVKNQIREAVQDKAIDGLAQVLEADPATAHQAKGLVLAFKDARKGGHRPAGAPSVPLPAPTEGLRVRTEPNVSEGTVKRLKQISLQVKKAPTVGVPPWRLQEFLNKLPETERAVYELRAAMVEASEELSRAAVYRDRKGVPWSSYKSTKVEKYWTGAVGRRVGDGKLMFASSSDDPKALAAVKEVAKKYGGEVVTEAAPWEKGHHAESRILWAFEVDKVGATRAICYDCDSAMREFGVDPLTPVRPK
jgi:hypothetical protein